MNKEILKLFYNERKNIIVSGDMATNKTNGVIFDIVDNIVEKEENILVTDAKEEYLERYYQILKEKNYNIITINFRNPNQSDGWNLFEHAYNLYKQNKTDQAIEFLEIIVHNIFKTEKSMDPFWTDMASNLFLGIVLAMFDDAKKEEINLNSVKNLLDSVNFSYGTTDYFSEYLKYKKPTDLTYTYASQAVFTPNDTKDSILAVTKQQTSKLFANKGITNLTNKTTYKLDDKKTAIFLINKDEDSSLNYLASIFISELYYILINNQIGNFNFILDNFDSLGTIDKFSDMLSSSVSRNIKFTIGTRSIEKLYDTYGDYLKKLTNKIEVSQHEIVISFDKQLITLDNIFKPKTVNNFEYPILETKPIEVFDVRKFVLEHKKDTFEELNIENENISTDELIMKIDKKIKELDKQVDNLS